MTASASTSISRITTTAAATATTAGPATSSTSHFEENGSGIENYLFLAYEKRILVVDLETRTINNLNTSGGIKNKKVITAIAVHPRVPVLATCSIDGEVRLWDYQLQTSVLVTETVFPAAATDVTSSVTSSDKSGGESAQAVRRHTVKFDRTGMFLAISATDGNFCAWGPPTNVLQQLLAESFEETSGGDNNNNNSGGGDDNNNANTSGNNSSNSSSGDGGLSKGMCQLTFYGYHRFKPGDMFDFEFCDNTTQFFPFYSPVVVVLSKKGVLSSWRLNSTRKDASDPCILPFPFMDTFSFNTKPDVLRRVAVRDTRKLLIHPTKNLVLTFPFCLVSKYGEYHARLFAFTNVVDPTSLVAPLPAASTSTSFSYPSEYALYMRHNNLWGFSIMGNEPVKLKQTKPQALTSAELLAAASGGLSFPVSMAASYPQKVCAVVYKIFAQSTCSDDAKDTSQDAAMSQNDVISTSYRCTLLRTDNGKQSPDAFPACRDVVFCGKDDECYAMLKEDRRTVEVGQTQLMSLAGELIKYSVGDDFCVEKMFYAPHSPASGTGFFGFVRDTRTGTLCLAPLMRENGFVPGKPIITFEKATQTTVAVKNSCDPGTRPPAAMDEIDRLLLLGKSQKEKDAKKKKKNNNNKSGGCGNTCCSSLDEVPLQVVWQEQRSGNGGGGDVIGAVLTSYQRIYFVDRKTLRVIRVFDFGAGNCQILSIHWVGWVLLFTTSTHVKALYSDGTTEPILSLNTNPTCNNNNNNKKKRQQIN